MSDRYQSHIDGIRAIAVLVVIANHLNPAWMPAGYLGVDMFFVISGYVISMSLWGKTSWRLKDFLLDFYGRRMQRLLPALAFAVFFAGFAVCLLIPDPTENLKTGVAALFGVSNFVLYFSASDYFTSSIQANIFAHTWSLGVEEQFYLLFPLLVWSAAKYHNKIRAFVLLISGLSALSIIGFLWLYPIDPGEMYFLSPIRFWEMGVGALAFLIDNSNKGQRRRNIYSWTAMLAMALLLLFPIKPLVGSTYLIVFTVILTAWVIVAAKHNPALVRLLNFSVVRRIGLISYSLYLWHWIFIVLARWTFGVNEATIGWILLATFIFAEISYRFVENPVRRRVLKNPICMGLTLSAIIALTLIYAAPQFKSNFLKLESKLLQSPNGFLDIKGLLFGLTCIVDDGTRPLKSDTFDNCTLEPNSQNLPTIWGMGDSHAGHLQAMLMGLHEQAGVGINLIETPGHHFPSTGRKSFQRELILKEVEKRVRPGDIFLLSRLYLKRYENGAVDDLGLWVKEVKDLAIRLRIKGVNVVVVGPPPIFNFEYKSTCGGVFFPENHCSVLREKLRKRIDPVEAMLTSAAVDQENLYFFPTFEKLCPPSQIWCSPIDGETFMYLDRDHLNLYGAGLLTQDFQRFLISNGLLK
ncbi:acyltransferase family protein [Ottowia thiooxydans]|uniref:acyltransferase family protein n=1 Tax=Ottowia thiooxydans TaxID=219182 RepID=UPI000684F4D7|nr:acyltransferase family protein [Ottowia thiooxydans]